MKSAVEVSRAIDEMKVSGMPPQEIAWKAALMCVGWPYVFGGRGEYCTPANRRARDWQGHPTIKSKCKNFDGAGTCSGCKWLPGGEKVRFFDCRGFTYWILLQVYGWKLMGAGCTSQWNNADNWKAKGKISEGIPADTLVCLFYSKDGKEKTWEHTGFGLNGETIECSSGVQHSESMNRKWTHWAVPKCVDANAESTVTPIKPTLRRGDKGEYVTLLQTQLMSRGYALGPCGVDGQFGKATFEAVKQFQQDWGLTVDGVVGKNTWMALDSTPISTLKTVHIPHLTQAKAEALKKTFPDAWITEDDNA